MMSVLHAVKSNYVLHTVKKQSRFNKNPKSFWPNSIKMSAKAFYDPIVNSF